MQYLGRVNYRLIVYISMRYNSKDSGCMGAMQKFLCSGLSRIKRFFKKSAEWGQKGARGQKGAP